MNVSMVRILVEEKGTQVRTPAVGLPLGTPPSKAKRCGELKTRGMEWLDAGGAEAAEMRARAYCRT